MRNHKISTPHDRESDKSIIDQLDSFDNHYLSYYSSCRLFNNRKEINLTSELQAFIQHFADEEELRSAIEGLLSRREECSGVRTLHGNVEYGKDLIFYAPAGLGRLALNACVVKLDKITGSASDPKSGARNVLIQCNQALDTPVIGTQGHEEWVSCVYVICPNELSPSAMQSISGEFKGRSSQIEFICGHDLLKLFRQFWPDFIFFQPDLLSAHLDALVKEFESDKNIHRLAIVHGLSTLAKQKRIYVEPTLSQEKGNLIRGVPLPDHSSLSTIVPDSEMSNLNKIIEQLVTSLNILDYLSPTRQDKGRNFSQELYKWSTKLTKSWSDEFSKAQIEAFQRKGPLRAVPIPSYAIDEFLKSAEYRFVEDIYRTLDNEIDKANASVNSFSNKIDILNSTGFSMYGSLLHATTVCFPTIRFGVDNLIEWTPDEVLNSGRHILVTGAPGFGKTSFCRNHFLKDLEKFRCGKSSILPLYFAAHSIAVKEGHSFEDVFVRQEIAIRLAEDSMLTLRIYLDGLDEIQSTESRNRILNLTKNACAQNSRYQCVATARDHVGGYSTSWLVRVKLSPMSAEKLRELVTAWLEGDADLIAKFYAELKQSESLLPVLGVPLLATLTVLVFKTLHRLPENKLRLYQMFIDLHLGGWNLAKGLQRTSAYTSTFKMLFLTRLAGMMHAREIKECTRMQMLSTLKQVAPKMVVQLQSIVSELVEDGLIVSTGRSSYIFPHLSFQEYLTAKDAIDPSRQVERRIVQSYLSGDDWYKEVATFLVCMTTSPLRMRDWIVGLAKEFVGPYALSSQEKRAGYLIARLSESFPECRSSQSDESIS